MWSFLLLIFIIVGVFVAVFTRQREGESNSEYGDRVVKIVAYIMCGLFLLALILITNLMS